MVSFKGAHFATDIILVGVLLILLAVGGLIERSYDQRDKAA